eukprot:TRINITY_DN43024_c0_g1_i1.p1 TRINITY_DN43024_c0_g1~~TRINITY_DN43024_c0_g1_i1.p1  ORF type:complete len:739 (+),score=59.71 TRINITY_DN43024_c0_g1_i1:215-2218(+)
MSALCKSARTQSPLPLARLEKTSKVAVGEGPFDVIRELKAPRLVLQLHRHCRRNRFMLQGARQRRQQPREFLKMRPKSSLWPRRCLSSWPPWRLWHPRGFRRRIGRPKRTYLRRRRRSSYVMAANSSASPHCRVMLHEVGTSGSISTLPAWQTHKLWQARQPGAATFAALCWAWYFHACSAMSRSFDDIAARVNAPHSSALDENPSCWTDGFSYRRCCLGDGEAEGCWGGEAPGPDGLFPHTRERCCESPCGATLRGRIAREGASRCAGLTFQNVTLVTGLWNLQREKWIGHSRYQEGSNRAFERYLHWMDVGLLQKRQAMFLFLDAEAAAFATARRTAYGLGPLTCVVEVEKDELPQQRWRQAYLLAHAENARRLPNDTQPEVVHADYTLVVNSKPELLACAALWNPFASTSFAWVDAGGGRKNGFPTGPVPVRPPRCEQWALCVGRRMWLMFDFREKLKRLEHGTTFDTTVLLGGREGVLFYAVWFQWAISRYLVETVMDDEQSVIAEVWWAGGMRIRSFFGMTWADTLAQLVPRRGMRRGDVRAQLPSGAGLEPSENVGTLLGHWFGDHPNQVSECPGRMWVPREKNLFVVENVPVKHVTDEHLERIAYALWCIRTREGGDLATVYGPFCARYLVDHQQEEYQGMADLPVVTRGLRLLQPHDVA